ncbi:MAG TPA: leucyl/phenylalanyl-tRNA--protein transferase [Pirellulales bacterium]|jgi:leucyl/phenylalanyl-tRNA--protein transferase|nr:leucyl/phenylalanyl-tRNA--protein transferase [Pirellulales bacterium]
MTPSQFFPPITKANIDGVLAVGGELSVERLIDAYRHGIFPWPNQWGEVEWHSPPLRAVFELDSLHVSRRLARTLRGGRFEIRRDTAFRECMLGCATAQDRRDATWITPAMVDAYCRLHMLGFAHSVEAWHAGELVGGVYGVAIGAMFAAESMFYRERDASKVALMHLAEHLYRRGYELFDIQQWTPNSARLGCVVLPRAEFLRRLEQAIEKPVTFG